MNYAEALNPDCLVSADVWAKVDLLQKQRFHDDDEHLIKFSLFFFLSLSIIITMMMMIMIITKNGGEIERNDSGVGSETSGTAQRLRRMRRLKSSHHQQTEGSSSPSDDCPTPWCVDCDQPIESQQEG